MQVWLHAKVKTLEKSMIHNKTQVGLKRMCGRIAAGHRCSCSPTRCHLCYVAMLMSTPCKTHTEAYRYTPTRAACLLATACSEPKNLSPDRHAARCGRVQKKLHTGHLSPWISAMPPTTAQGQVAFTSKITAKDTKATQLRPMAATAPGALSSMPCACVMTHLNPKRFTKP
jgi:hypothetical protein